MRRYTTALIAAATLCVVLAGCAAGVIEPSSLAGLSLDVAKSRLPEGTTVLTYDVSTAVLSKDPTYVDGGDDGAWFVLAACTTDGQPARQNGPNVALAVVPEVDVTEDIRAEARQHDYNELLTECEHS